jgi:U4/U6.U5 tri-snRNP-associated protein 2
MKKISLFYKKVWNNKNFKGVISPHEVFQIICERSAKFFKIGKKGDPSTFLVWSLNNIDKTIRKSKEKTFDLLSLF